MTENISVLLDEKRVFKPSKDFVNQTNVKQWMDQHNIKTYDELLKKAEDWKWFWGEIAKDVVEFYTPYKQVVEWNEPFAKWFTGAKYNIVHDAIDKHVTTWRKNKVAIIFEGEPGDVRKLTYNDLSIQVNKLANALKELGIKKGDRVGIYLPMIPELPIAMLACAKIGAVHSVVFSGFSAAAFRDRANDCEVKLVITCDSFYRRGKKVPLKTQADEACKEAPSVKHMIVYQRTGDQVNWTAGRDHWWHEITKDKPSTCPTEQLDANDNLYFLYTSGTTGKPKGIIHAHAGYAVGIAQTLKWVFDIKDQDVYWCAADIGWVTGHSYIAYAPLILGATQIIYEGAPDWPQPDRWWDIIEKYGVSVFYTSPTSVRLFMRHGEDWLKKHDLTSLRLLGSVGEPINPEAWIWYYKNIGGERCQIMDTWWQTETGHFVISPLPITPIKPGSATKPLPGMSAAVYDDKGSPDQGRRRQPRPHCTPGPACCAASTRTRSATRRPTGADTRASTSPATSHASTLTATSGSKAEQTTSSRSPDTASETRRSNPPSSVTPARRRGRSHRQTTRRERRVHHQLRRPQERRRTHRGPQKRTPRPRRQGDGQARPTR